MHHPADLGGGLKRRLPCDFIYGYPGGWGVLEVKATVEPSLPPVQWPPHQRKVCRDVRDAGGRYWLLVKHSDGIRLHEPTGWGAYPGLYLTLPKLSDLAQLIAP